MVRVDFTMEAEEQFEYLKSRNVKITQHWHKIWGEAHHHSFTIQGITKAYVLRAVNDQMAEAIRNGESFEKSRDKILEKLEDGENFISDGRLRFIFQQGMLQANGRVRCQKQMESSLPYIQYKHTRSGGGALKKNYREKHWKAHNKVFHKSDPWLLGNMPPNGFGCHCKTVAISSYRLKKEGLKPVPEGDLETVAENGFDYNMCASEMEQMDKVESIESKKAKKGSKIAEIALFENAYKRMKHFQELCNSETQDNSEDYDGGCIEANRRFEKYKMDIMNSNNPHILKGTLSYLDFTEEEEIMDFSILACALASHYPEKSVKYRKFSKMQKSRVGNVTMGVNREHRTLMIREDVLKSMNSALFKIKQGITLNFKDLDTLSTLWHELLHLEQTGSKKFTREDVKNILGEIINELTARYTFETLLKDLGAKYDSKTLKEAQMNGSGYRTYVKRFREILKLLDIDEKELVGDGSFNRDLKWDNALNEVIEQIEKFVNLSEKQRKIIDRLFVNIAIESRFNLLLKGLQYVYLVAE